jgi:hypothetical protein
LVPRHNHIAHTQRARAAVQALTSGRRRAADGADNIPFSREVRKTFEAATNVRGLRGGKA